jgi:hypothetical protein
MHEYGNTLMATRNGIEIQEITVSQFDADACVAGERDPSKESSRHRLGMTVS